MIKTIILDESKVNAFLKELNAISGIILLNPTKESVKYLLIERIEEFLKETKIEPQNTKTHKQ